MPSIVQIVTDSSCDLPRRILDQSGISVVPLVVRFGPEVYDDGELSADAFWEKAASSHPPQTSQPPVGAFETRFERLIAQGKQVLCLTLTGKHSGTFNAARLAAQRFGAAVQVFDSCSLSLGLGLQALVAAQAARAGRSIHEILDQLKGLRARTRLTIVLDTLENLRYGGRADRFIAIIDRMTRVLDIKPVLNVIEGQLRLVGMARSFRKGVKRVMSVVEGLGPLEHLAVVHTRRAEVAQAVADQLAERTGFSRERIWLQETGAALASHAGAGVVGVLAVSKS